MTGRHIRSMNFGHTQTALQGLTTNVDASRTRRSLSTHYEGIGRWTGRCRHLSSGRRTGGSPTPAQITGVALIGCHYLAGGF